LVNRCLDTKTRYEKLLNELRNGEFVLRKKLSDLQIQNSQKDAELIRTKQFLSNNHENLKMDHKSLEEKSHRMTLELDEEKKMRIFYEQKSKQLQDNMEEMDKYRLRVSPNTFLSSIHILPIEKSLHH
jgi:hypothetical protein